MEKCPHFPRNISVLLFDLDGATTVALEAAKKWYEPLLALSYAEAVESIDMIHIKGTMPLFFEEFSGTKLACTSVHLEGRVEDGVEKMMWGGALFLNFIEFLELYIITVRQDDLVTFNRLIPEDIATELLKMPKLALYIVEKAEDGREIVCLQLKLVQEPAIVDSTVEINSAGEQPNKSISIEYNANRMEMAMDWYHKAVQNDCIRRIDIKCDAGIKIMFVNTIVPNLRWRSALHEKYGASNCQRIVCFLSLVEFDAHCNNSTDIVAINTFKNPINAPLEYQPKRRTGGD